MATGVVLGVGAMLAVVSGSRAGNEPGANAFQFTVEPQFLTAGQTGLAAGVFTAASGSGQGSATHVEIKFDLPTGFQGGLAGTSSGCTGPDADNAFTCSIGTVNAGQTVKRFLTFTNGTAPASGTPYELTGCLSVDQGSGGQGGGGGSTESTCVPDTTTVVVPSTANTTRAGSCRTGTGSASTPLASSTTNLVSTSVQGNQSSSLGLPCTWAFVGENIVTSANDPSGDLVVPQISFMGFPLTDRTAPATWIVDLYSRPAGPFSNLDVLVDLDYTDGAVFDGVEPEACVDLVPPAGQYELPDGEDVCLVSLVKVGGGARATLLVMGTGGDPGSGFG